MTIILGYTSPSQRTSFLGADDREGISEARHDKIRFPFDRFLIAGVGNNTVFLTADVIGELNHDAIQFSNGTHYKLPSSIEEYCQAVIEALPVVADNLFKGYQKAVLNGTYSDSQFSMLKTQPNILLIIDTKNFRVVTAHFSTVFPPQPTYSYEVRELPSERALRLGIDNPTILSTLTPHILQHPMKWCKEQLDVARAVMVGAGFKAEALGHLGAAYLVRHNKIIRRTTFTSIADFAQRYYPVQK